MRSWTLVMTLLTLTSLPAWAKAPKQVNMPVGHSATLSLPGPVSRVVVDDESLVDVKREGQRVIFTGLTRGVTEATITTTEGELRFRIYVAADKYAMPE
jgi:Flp pilus assembly secretin CpaC